MSFGSYPKAGNLANNLQAADILSELCQEHGAFCVSPPLGPVFPTGIKYKPLL